MQNQRLDSNLKLKSILIPPSLLLLGMGLRMYGLDRTLGTGFRGFDEGLILRYFAFSLWENIFERYDVGGISHHMFNTILLKLMVDLFGEENALAIRFPTFLFAILCLWMIYKVAYRLFNDLAVARLSLLLAAILPIHVAWSQTARGYSLTMLLSISMIYATLNILEGRRTLWWSCFLFVTGFISVYTILTNVYLLFGLACWILLVLMVPALTREFGINPAAKTKNLIMFPGIFLGILVLSYLVYLPLVDQIAGHAQSEQNDISESFYGKYPLGMVLQLAPECLQYIFQDHLAWFLPFLLIGVFSGKVARRSYRLLPVMLFLLPFTVTLITGIAGYPRNYLFNLPLQIIFCAGGIIWAGQWVAKHTHHKPLGGIVTGGLVAAYVLTAFSILINQHYPFNSSPDGKLYRRMIEKHSSPLDLIMTLGINYHLYAQRVFQNNLRNILMQNKLSGVKVIYSDPLEFETFVGHEAGKKGHPLFKGRFQSLSGVSVTGGKRILSLTGGGSESLLIEDFGTNSNWTIISGEGSLAQVAEHKIAGDRSLLMTAAENSDLLIEGSLAQEIIIEKPSLMVLVSAWKSLTDSNDGGYVFFPVLSAELQGQAGLKRQVHLVRVNQGMSAHLKEEPISSTVFDWSFGASIGFMPPGKYKFSVLLKAGSGKSVLYDGIRLFLIKEKNN